MSTEPYGFLTVAGRAAEAAALANGTALEVAEIAWGTGTRAITGGETALENETARAAVHAQGVDPDNSSVAFFRRQFAAEDGPYTISEAGLIASDGTLLAIVTYPVPVSKPVNFALTFDILVAFSDLENLIITVQSAEAFVPAERKVSAGAALSGGGDMGQDRTIDLDFSELEALTAAAAHLTDDTAIIWDASEGKFKTIHLEAISEKVAVSAALAQKGRWLLKSAAYTAKAGERIAADVSGGAWTLSLPAAPVAGDGVTVAVIKGDVATNNLTIDGNGKTIKGHATVDYVDPAEALVTLRLVFDGNEWGTA